MADSHLRDASMPSALGGDVDASLVTGTTAGIDATTLEAYAALRSIVRRDTTEGYTGLDSLRCHWLRGLECFGRLVRSAFRKVSTESDQVTRLNE